MKFRSVKFAMVIWYNGDGWLIGLVNGIVS